MYLVVEVLRPQLAPQKKADPLDEDGVQLLHAGGIPRLYAVDQAGPGRFPHVEISLHVWPGFRVNWLPITK